VSVFSRLQRFQDDPMQRVLLQARVMRPYWQRRFRAFGAGSILYKPNWVYGPQQIEIGSNVVILKSAWLSVERVAWDRPAPVLKIGDGVAFRPYCTVSAAESVTIEDGVVLAAFTTVIDNDHVHTGGPNPNIVWAGGLATAPVRIGRGTWVGERVSILRGANIGQFCTIGANSVVKGTIPDYSVAVGAPARVVGSTRAQHEGAPASSDT
jgi:acetyltransferase-like isoleucine patch superfamily enzyme